MNTPIKKSVFILPLLMVGFLISANAQRGHDGGRSNGYSGRSGGSYSNRGSGGGGFSRQQRGSFERPAETNRQSNVFDRRMSDNRVADRGNVFRDNSFRRNNIGNVFSNRNAERNSARTQILGTQRNNRIVGINNTARFNRYPNVYNYGRGGYSVVRYGNYAPRGYYYVGAPRYSILPRTFVSIQFGGYPYYYDRGCFYGFYDGYYAPVFAPIGIRVHILPPGYFSIYVGPSLYYYYDGIFYRRYLDSYDEYEVVDPPMGAVVTSLPKGAKVAEVNGEKFYEFDGTYYKEGVNSKNEVVYTVVGKNGKIDNTEEAPVNTPSQQQAPQIGDEINNLPDNSRQVTINGEVLYVTPDNLYLKAETRDNTTVYKVVGKAENN
jgi:hypothetical protein